MDRLLVVAAYDPELVGLPDSVQTRAVGIGAIDAAAGTAQAIAELGPSHIIVMGTCGAYPGVDLAIGDLVVVQRALWQAPPAGVEIPEPVARDVVSDRGLCDKLAAGLGARRVVARGCEGVSVTGERAKAADGAGVEHMECFSIIRACQLANVPVAAVLAVANEVGENARGQWREHAAAVQASAVRALAAYLAKNQVVSREKRRPGRAAAE